MEMNKAVFLDRDGVINKDPPHYAHRIDQLELIEGSGTAIRILNERDYKIIVVSNQSGIARGYYEEKDILIFNHAISEELKTFNAHIDAFYYCPHHPEAKLQQYRIDCNCRKPKPGMLIESGKKYSINFDLSFLVGDKWSDIEAGQLAGCKTVLVRTGHGLRECEEYDNPVDYIAEDLLDAVQHFILL